MEDDVNRNGRRWQMYIPHEVAGPLWAAAVRNDRTVTAEIVRALRAYLKLPEPAIPSPEPEQPKRPRGRPRKPKPADEKGAGQ